MKYRMGTGYGLSFRTVKKFTNKASAVKACKKAAVEGVDGLFAGSWSIRDKSDATICRYKYKIDVQTVGGKRKAVRQAVKVAV